MSLKTFLKTDIWHVQIAGLPKWKAIWYRILRILILTSQGFTKSQIQQGASSLTYYSMLTVVPIIALLIGIARGFVFEKTLEEWLIARFAEHKDIIEKIFVFANRSIEETSGGLIAAIGVTLLIWSAINILSNVEFVMNQIWEVKKGRSLARRFTDYLAMLFLAPIIVILASGLTGYISAFLTTVQHGEVIERIAPLLIPFLSLISFLLTALFFTFLYIFMPNTRVQFVPALIAGLFTAVVYMGIQWLYLYFQIGVASYNAVYGTFAAIPLFLIWLHISWYIILLGAKFCFAVQNVDAYEFLSEDIQLSYRFRLICSLRIAQYCIKKFVKEESPPNFVELSHYLSIPLPLTKQLVFQLVGAGVLVEVKREDQEDAYQPAKSPEKLSMKRVLDMISDRGQTIPLPPSHELNLILQNLEKFNAAMDRSEGNVLLKDIT